MANPKKPQGRPAAYANKRPAVYSKNAPAATLFDSLNNWADRKSRMLTIVAFTLSAIFAILLFQAKMDLGADDSAYLQRAYDFTHKGIFPSYQGALYPIVLSILMMPFGMNVIVLKCASIIFNFFSLYFMYKAFKGRVSSFVLYSVVFLMAMNTFILNFSSYTYSEPFFMMLQSLVLLYFFKLNDALEANEDKSFKGNYKSWLLVGLFLFLLSMTRTIGYFSFGAFILYFIIRKQYKYILYLFIAFLAFQLPAMLIEKAIWHTGNDSSQANILLLKNPYDPSEGKETLNGFFLRFKDNSIMYLSRRFFQIMSLRSLDSTDQSGALTFFFIAFALFSVYRIFKAKNYPMLLTSLYTMGMITASFFAIQTRWDQPRIIMVFVPFTVLVMLYGLYDLLKKAPWIAQFLMIPVMGIPLLMCTFSTLKAANANSSVLSKNMHGDIYYGYTPDWVNFLKTSRWCADSLPKSAGVASRKAGMSFVYGGGNRDFFNIARAYYTNADSVLNFFKEKNVQYIILASLRLNPQVADERAIINTIHQMLVPVAQKYPNRLRLVHQDGDTEPSYVYQILDK